MKFKISQQQGANSHSKAVTCVTWISSDEIYSCGDDHSLMCWKFEDGAINSRVVAELPEDFYPTDMQWQPRPAQASGVGAVKKQSLDVLLISTADGKFHLVSRAGRVEKSVQAHTGATLSGKWSQDGSALMTAGEDGLIKVWSRSGMLRSTAVRGSQEVFASAWSPDGSSILYSQASLLLVQSLTASGKPTKVSNEVARSIASGRSATPTFVSVGSSRRPRARRRLESIPRSHRVRRRRLPLQGEPRSRGNDARPISVDLRAPQVWDANGAILYASGPGDQPITALSWCSSGSYFAVGSFNAVKLCDRSGWPHSTEKLQVGSVYDVAWSSDGTQAALACSSGSVPIAHVIERRLAYGGYEATLIKRKAVLVSEVGSDVRETLDIAERVVQLAFGFDHLVAVTPSQCHVYSVKNWNTPAIVDLKGGSVSAVLLADKHFLLLEWNAMSLFNYQGRSLGAPRWKNMTAEPLYPPCVSVCCDTIVARDQTNRRLVHVLEVSPKKPLAEAQPYAHAQDVTSLGLNYVGGLGDRQLALVDANRDLFLVPVRSAGFGRACRIGRCRPRVAGQLRRTDPLEPPPPLQRRWRRASPGRATPTCWPACSTPLCPSGCAPAACTAATASSRAGRASTRTAGDTRAVARRPRPDRLSLSLVFFSQRVRQAARDREREQRPRDRSPGRRRPGRLLVLRLRRYSAPAHPQRTVGRGGLGLPHSPGMLARQSRSLLAHPPMRSLWLQSDTLWTCLAVMAIDGRQLNIAEEACAAVARFDKVDYIRYIKVSGSPFYRSPFAIERSRPAVAQEMPNETERLAEMALLAGDLLGAEGILLQSAMIAEAIRMNLQMYNWSRALELALKHKKLLAEVLDARKRYLETLEKREVNRSFLAVYGNIAKAQAAKRVRVGVPIDAPRERVDGAAHPSLLLPGGAREGEGEGARGSGAQAARVQGRREEQRRRGEIDDPGEGLNRCGRFCSSASFVQSAVLSIFIR
ncbi:intraflagellar transport protein 80 homolog isoform X2 [Phymastichus coffea]|uniref:intraflagellar transport protein 80 homolog isoform X2 n=1 Tax=Phymastichus coffea TaxID=108790 RepID=UPI00273BEF9C|nr:intraflagellar transport protein 80 homolog isoform X2 [Phymastichus coffea]